MRRRDDPTPRARDDTGGRLDNDQHLASGLLNPENSEAGQAQQCLDKAGSVTHRQGPPHVAAVKKPQH